MVIDTFLMTLFIILIFSIVAAFIRRGKKDKCLKNFKNDVITLETIDGTIEAKGLLNVENSGLEFMYPYKVQDFGKQIQSSYILYKYEFPKIQVLIRFHADLSEEGKARRVKEIQKTYKPGRLKKLRRGFMNIFKIARDSVSEVLNVLINYAKQTKTAGAAFASHQQYVTKMKKELVESVGTAFEPLMEKYIGSIIVFDLVRGTKVEKYSGILKDYTKDFIEIMDVEYILHEGEHSRISDIIVPQKFGIIRHFGE